MTTVTDSAQIIDDLNDLIQLEYDAISAYQAAIDRLDNSGFKEKFTEFLGDHRRHVTELSNLVRNEGGTAKSSGDVRKVLTKGKVVLADMAGDKAILKAMKSNENETNSEYEDAVETGYAPHIQTVMENALADERRHRAWIVETLEGL